MIDKNYGYQSPEDGDESSNQWMPVIEEFIDRMIDHRHDGNDSRFLDSVIVNKDTYQIVAGRIAVTSANYSIGAATAEIGLVAVTAGMYAYGNDLPLETSVLAVTGNTVELDNDFTSSASATGEVTFSDYKKIDTSMFEKTVPLPNGYVAKNYHYKFYISSSGAYQFYSLTPTIVDTEVNEMKFRINDDQYDIVVSLM